VSKGASSCRANIASATSVSISAISSDRPASLLAWPRHGISVGVGGCFLSCEIEVGPPVILIMPVGVISTPQTCNPAASKPSMARTMSAGVKRNVLRLIF
jgi:hypothetical protein